MKIYISGPMTGLPDLNFPVFHQAAAELRAQGVDVVNPAEFGEEPGKTWADYMRKDIKALMDCDTIHMLPGWRDSEGARVEYYLARKLGFTVSGAA
jgi:hypothetical protein